MTSSVTTDQNGHEYTIVVNGDGHHSIWRTDKPVPGGWTALEFTGAKEACLTRIAEVWTDMRPLAVRMPANGSPAEGRAR